MHILSAVLQLKNPAPAETTDFHSVSSSQESCHWLAVSKINVSSNNFINKNSSAMQVIRPAKYNKMYAAFCIMISLQ
jgi:hypothetical protein